MAGIRESDFADFAASQNTLVATAFTQLLPGWPDTMVPPLGGLGWVHLIQHAGTLYQLDLYLAPSQRIGNIAARARGRMLYTAPRGAELLSGPVRSADAVITAARGLSRN